MNIDPGVPVGYEPRFLPALSEDERKALMAGAIVRNFSAGAALFHENQLADRVLVLQEGFVKLSCFSDDGHEVVLGIRGPGDVLGELSALDGGTRSATAVALEPVQALAVPTSSFNDFLDRNPRVFRV